ncbi:hypothetical protein NW752_009646 [Fusarium irregulare]|uniref:Uncharacterized protein n=1 Tax=Fusarium irregulare TaxID=2494466 RepID=A0A9W8U5E0_9HYPO|nr:hypothetical protein NW766_011421 [Fusarium irregulare]KAJ4009345.1 hypothetical protein NW752_009646 [Fusarium irregulare]
MNVRLYIGPTTSSSPASYVAVVKKLSSFFPVLPSSPSITTIAAPLLLPQEHSDI